MESSAAMTKTMLGDAEVMHGLGPVPLLQWQSAVDVESRWMRTVPTSRESARKAFGNVRFCTSDRQTDRQFIRDRSRTPHDVLSRRSTRTRQAHR